MGVGGDGRTCIEGGWGRFFDRKGAVLCWARRVRWGMAGIAWRG